MTAGLSAAIRTVQFHLSDRTLQRIIRRFKLAQCHIRTALLTRCPPPNTPPRPPTAQVVAHLEAAFPDAECPIAEFQHAMNMSFL